MGVWYKLMWPAATVFSLSLFYINYLRGIRYISWWLNWEDKQEEKLTRKKHSIAVILSENLVSPNPSEVEQPWPYTNHYASLQMFYKKTMC